MRVVVAGGHGQIALLLERRLAERGDESLVIVRNPDGRAFAVLSGDVPVREAWRACDRGRRPPTPRQRRRTALGWS